MNLLSKSVMEVQARVPESSRLTPIAGGTKPALSTPTGGAAGLDLSAFRGIIEYQPEEFTFNAYAGTRIANVNELLQENKQYLPFDPPLVRSGATLGGTVASGLSAGFDLAKLMVGSRGELGLLVELSFKVFPKPEKFVTFRREFPNLEGALQVLRDASISQLDIDSLDLVPEGSSTILWIRIGGLATALPSRIIHMVEFLGDCDVIQDSRETDYWDEMREFLWVPSGWSLVKVPITPRLILSIEQKLMGLPNSRRYSCGGQVGWFAFPDPSMDLDNCLLSLDLSGMAIFGSSTSKLIGKNIKSEFYRRVKDVMDPENRFGEA